MPAFQSLPLPLKNWPEILETIFVWKMCGFQPHSGSEAVLQSFPDQFPLPASPSFVSSIYQYEFPQTLSSLGREGVSSGDNFAFGCVERTDYQVRG